MPDAEKSEIYQLVQKALVLGFREPEVWIAQASFYRPQLHVDTYPVTREFFEKAVVYSNYQARYLRRNFSAIRMWHWNITIALERASEGEDLTTDHWAHVAEDPQKQLEDINCDYVRAALLLDAVCKSPGSSCSRNGEENEAAAEIAGATGEARMCPAIYDVSLQDLLYPEQP